MRQRRGELVGIFEERTHAPRFGDQQEIGTVGVHETAHPFKPFRKQHQVQSVVIFQPEVRDEYRRAERLERVAAAGKIVAEGGACDVDRRRAQSISDDRVRFDNKDRKRFFQPFARKFQRRGRNTGGL